MLQIDRVTSLDTYDLNSLIEESIAEGYRFIKRLVDEFEDGSNRFNKTGEALFVALIDNRVVGVGGLNIDPYRDDKNVGRVRHVYVLKSSRRLGVGKELLRTIIEEAKKHFSILTLTTDNPVADRLYIASGFTKVEGWNKASHIYRIGASNDEKVRD